MLIRKNFFSLAKACSLVTFLVVGRAAVATAENSFAARSYHVEQEGVAVELGLVAVDGGEELREGRGAKVRFKISDTTTAQPLAGLYPAAWMSLLKEGKPSTPERCVQKVEEFLSGGLLTQAELDLNTYYVLALNHDASITVVDPLFGFGGTKLLALIDLHGPGEDWVASRDQSLIFVSVPDSGEVAVISTLDWRLVAHVPVGPRPARLMLQEDGARLWVAFDGGVAVLDARSGLDAGVGSVVARIETGRAAHDLTTDDDSRYVFLANPDDDTVSVVDMRTLVKVKDLATGDGPVSLDHSPLAGTVYVSHEGDGTIAVIGVDQLEVVAHMTSKPGLGQIRVAPGGRLVFAVNPRADTVSIIDSSSNRIVQTGELNAGPDQIAFSETLAYIRHQGDAEVLMIPLPQVGEEGVPVPVVDFPGGQWPASKGRRPSVAPAIVGAPGGLAMLVANPADEMIYFYQEGMAAPMGGFSNYDRQPRAALVIDRSLGERSQKGVYETAAKMRAPGRYEMAFFLDTPRIVHCFPVEVRPDPELERQRQAARPVQVEVLEAPPRVSTQKEFRVRFRLTDPHDGVPRDGLADVLVMAFAPGNWHRRYLATGIGDGVYELSLALPEPGAYQVLLSCPSRNLTFQQGPQLIVEASSPKLPMADIGGDGPLSQASASGNKILANLGSIERPARVSSMQRTMTWISIPPAPVCW